MKTKLSSCLIILLELFFIQNVIAQAPAISYTGPQTYTVGTTITPLTASNTGGAPAVNGQTSTFAGSGSNGAANGTGTAASFSVPIGVAVDGQGNTYVADDGNCLIRKITPAGVVTTVAGTGSAGFVNGTGTAASFSNPYGVAADAAGNLYVADYGNNAIRKITPAGVVSTFAGNGTAGYIDGTGTAAEFKHPVGLVLDAAGNVYVADFQNTVIRKITPAGVVSTFAGSGTYGSANGTGTAASFGDLTGLAFDPSGNLIVADYTNNMIRKVTPSQVVTTIAGQLTAGWTDAAGTAAKFNNPSGVALDKLGNIYVADLLNRRVRKIDLAGNVTTLAGTGSSGAGNGAGSAATFNAPFGIAIDGSGTLVVADYGNNIVRKVASTPFTIYPALPAGLGFNVSNGTISGSAAVSSASTSYSITAYNLSGSSTASLSITVVAAPAGAQGQSLNQNYVITNTPRISGIVNDSTMVANYTDKTKVQTALQYVDGLGRPIQTVQKQSSPLGYDVVAPVAYDQYGREVTKYLPYTPQTGAAASYRPNATGGDQQAFYVVPPSGVSAITDPYAQTNFDNSPLNRSIEQGETGIPWQLTGVNGGGHTVKMVYTLNNSTSFATDSVNGRQAAMYYATINADSSRTLHNNGYYTAGTLTVTISKDENWVSGRAGTVEEYKDIDGQVVLKRVYNYTTAVQVISTYYVYDDMGKLAFVLTPISGADGAVSITQGTLDNLCYQYQYDGLGRAIAKKIPGKGWEYTIFNTMDQPVATQDANQRANKQWIFTKYDILGRIILSGIWNNGNTAISRASLQTTLTGITTNLWEAPVNSGNGYTNVAWPTTSVTATLTTDFYDTYANIPSLPTTYTLSTGVSLMIRGLPTVKKTAVLNTPTDQLWDVIYYDDLGRTTKTYAQHYLGGTANTNNFDLNTVTYNFTNAPTTTARQHWNTVSTTVPLVTIINTYIYDQIGRKLKTWEQIQNGNSTPTTKTLISQIGYNEIGQVLSKQLHSTDSVNFLQAVAYTYNERGWLLTSSAPLFNMRLDYNANTNKAYNGNIMYQYWGATLGNHYTYTYDKLNRLTVGGSATGNAEYPAYDLVGNLTSMWRYQTSTLIDQLSYTYTSGGNPTNQVQSIADASGSNLGLSNGTTNYVYDGNGNELSAINTVNTAQNKSFSYNLLNLSLVATVPTGTLTYTYDAAGNKLRRVNTVTNNTTDYIGGIQYDGATTPALSFIQTEEGKAVVNGTSYDYTYYLGDNLGNTRITFDTKTGSAVQQQPDDYYPFGLEINTSVLSPKNEYLYNKKELQEELTEYDYGARFYDPIVGRWNTIDPLAEIAPSLTPYRYCYNNPINFTDPYGLWETDAKGNQTTNKKEDIERFTLYMQAESAINTTPTISQISTFVGQEKAGGIGKLTNGTKLLNPVKIQRYLKVNGDAGYNVNKKSFSNFWYQVQGDLTPTALDPRTWHQNLYGLGPSYAGSNNPKSYNGSENYDKFPDQIDDIPAYFHDLDFNKLHDHGASDVFNDPRTQAANAKLIMSELGIAQLQYVSPVSRARAIIIAIGIGFADTYNIIKNAPAPDCAPIGL